MVGEKPVPIVAIAEYREAYEETYYFSKELIPSLDSFFLERTRFEFGKLKHIVCFWILNN
ncbi:MAG: hypothetical protein H0X63_00425 [Flavobacteriales bacterium]|nr:hypothetical protein [Flavobacteriales bacterium]